MQALYVLVDRGQERSWLANLRRQLRAIAIILALDNPEGTRLSLCQGYQM